MNKTPHSTKPTRAKPQTWPQRRGDGRRKLVILKRKKKYLKKPGRASGGGQANLRKEKEARERVRGVKSPSR
jgi:hypothetical protein